MSSKKIYIVFITTLSLLAVMLLAELVIVSIANDDNKRTLENVYESTVYDLSDSLDNLKINASKLMVARGSEDNRQLITDTYRHAETASQSLSKLPLDGQSLSQTIKFLNQVGDWCVSYNSAIESGADTSAYKEQADDIFDVTSEIADNFAEISRQISEKGIYSSIGENRLMPTDFAGLVFEMQHNSVEYPELIYDGPFSDNKTYDFKTLSRLSDVDEKRALEIAKKEFGMKVESVSFTEGKTGLYVVLGKSSGKEAMLTVTKKGGMPVSYDKNRGVGAVRKSRVECEAIATQFTAKLGFENMTPVWYNGESGVALVNLAPKVNGIIYYPDLVKIKVAMDDGEVIGFESSGFRMNSHDRSDKPVIDEGTARGLVSDKISVKNVRLAVIPHGEKEVLCYEVNGEYRGLDYFIYVDAVMGKEIEVLRVVDNKQGSLTM